MWASKIGILGGKRAYYLNQCLENGLFKKWTNTFELHTMTRNTSYIFHLISSFPLALSMALSSICSDPFSFSFILYRCDDTAKKKPSKPFRSTCQPCIMQKKKLANIHLHINLLLRLFNLWWSKLINLVTSIDIVYFPSNRVYAWLQLKSAGWYDWRSEYRHSTFVLYLSYIDGILVSFFVVIASSVCESLRNRLVRTLFCHFVRHYSFFDCINLWSK